MSAVATGMLVARARSLGHVIGEATLRAWLRSLAEDGLVAELEDDRWMLTVDGWRQFGALVTSLNDFEDSTRGANSGVTGSAVVGKPDTPAPARLRHEERSPWLVTNCPVPGEPVPAVDAAADPGSGGRDQGPPR